MKVSLTQLAKEAASIRSTGMSPVTTLRLDSPIPSPKSVRDRLQKILTEVDPKLLIIDEKETSSIPKKHSLKEYLTFVDVVTSFCHSHHTLCTNGGLEDTAIITYYLSSLKEGAAKRNELLSELHPEQTNRLNQKEKHYTDNNFNKVVEKLLSHYRNSKLDYVNISWNGFPEWLFGEIASFVLNRTDKKIVTTEISVPAEPDGRDDYLSYIRNMRLDFVIWKFPYKEITKSDLIDSDGTLTDITESLRRANCHLF